MKIRCSSVLASGFAVCFNRCEAQAVARGETFLAPPPWKNVLNIV